MKMWRNQWPRHINQKMTQWRIQYGVNGLNLASAWLAGYQCCLYVLFSILFIVFLLHCLLLTLSDDDTLIFMRVYDEMIFSMMTDDIQ